MRVRTNMVAVQWKHDRFKNWLLKRQNQHDLMIDWELEIREREKPGVMP